MLGEILGEADTPLGDGLTEGDIDGEIDGDAEKSSHLKFNSVSLN